MTNYDVIDFYRQCKFVCRALPYNGDVIDNAIDMNSPMQSINTIQQHRGKVSHLELFSGHTSRNMSLEQYLSDYFEADVIKVYWRTNTYAKGCYKPDDRVTTISRSPYGWRKTFEWKSSLEDFGNKGVPIFTAEQRKSIIEGCDKTQLDQKTKSYLVSEFRNIVYSIITDKYNTIGTSRATFTCDIMVEQCAPSLAWKIANYLTQ